MQTISASTYNANSFGFSLQTSSGDTIDLSMYNERSMEFSHTKDGGTTLTTLSLSHSYGYSFSYEGNGIDANDQKEIDEAMKVIQPMMDEYLKSVEQSNTNAAKLTNTAYDINALLPKSENLDTQNYANDSLLKSLDKILEKAQNQNEKMLQEAQKLFDTILKQQKGFELYM
ncbi:MAG: ATP/GTP-binding protein [Campylobacterales bacterium]|nr:ATP/GTP-binding protein [Campylobacterales bacterium]